MPSARTDLLEIHYETGGDPSASTVLLLHGWPDDVRSWRRITPVLESGGCRWIAPWLRGCGPTRFLSEATLRDGRTEALAQDAIDLMDSLNIERFSVIGHDWGARVAYALAALIPHRLLSIAAISLAYAPRGAFVVPAFQQSRAWWYQWFMSVDKGAEAVAKDPNAFAKMQWETWSPPGWFDEAEFKATARSFENPDWLAITLNGYRSRWRDDEERDARYAELSRRVASVEQLDVPTLMVQGATDGTVLASSSEGQEKWFSRGYQRIVLDGIGHFPTREAADVVGRRLLSHLQEHD
ncbi:alpha/beta hydrolase [Dyella sp. BiH032]|uniref:alpha/beta fold hydrolase n=1 Tax=Dyella sp. BiH032 TaxID=3075430 RepID=UPI0028935789|nr:alpha/beta hydrolase [Dyella sp. BiH032]WNL45653.1 alpha/beta hydrolase [Dyella sp. BiH032]